MWSVRPRRLRCPICAYPDAMTKDMWIQHMSRMHMMDPHAAEMVYLMLEPFIE